MSEVANEEYASNVKVFDELDDLFDSKAEIGDETVRTAEEDGCDDGFDDEKDQE